MKLLRKEFMHKFNPFRPLSPQARVALAFLYFVGALIGFYYAVKS